MALCGLCFFIERLIRFYLYNHVIIEQVIAIMNPHIVLFDIDGVLLEERGYRAGLRLAIAYFLREINLDDRWLPDESEVSAFEAMGITSEWDIIPIWLAFALEKMARASVEPVHWPDWPAVVAWTRETRVKCERTPLQRSIHAIRPLLQSGVVASEAVLQACLQGSFDPLRTISNQGVLQALLKSTRDFTASRMTQVFQAFILGSEMYARMYRSEAPVKCSSAIETYDRPVIKPENVARLEKLSAQRRLAMAALTARPSLPPGGLAVVRAGYSPEAEIALRLLGLDKMPLVGYGTMVHAADRFGLYADGLLKPNGFQALAATAAAWTGDVLSSVEWAGAINHRYGADGFGSESAGNTTVELDRLPSVFDLHVFEDTTGGIRSARRAAELLHRSGVQANVKAWGITTNEEKKTALEGVGAVVYPDINQALRSAFPQWF